MRFDAGETAAFPRHPSGMHNLTRLQTAIAWLAQLTVAVILLQTLFFKFTAAEESVYIFSTIHAEPWGRIGSGVIELVASALLFIPATAPIGAALAMASMAGAILTHLTVLGIEVKGDGGLLFALAVTALVGSAVVLLVRRTQLPVVGRYFEMA
jgi:ABC-type Fe3+-siderophore transport system permease subunit